MSEQIPIEDSIPGEDIDYLKSQGYKYDFVSHDKVIHLIIREFPIPDAHYNVSATDMLIVIPAGYPDTRLDMFWTYPYVTLKNGGIPLKTEHRSDLHGISWQGWSRHGEWRPGVDNFKTFIRSIIIELNKGK